MSLSQPEFEVLRDRMAANCSGVEQVAPKPEKTNKYRVAPKAERTVGLLTFASKAEALAYQTLLMLQEMGDVTKLELQPVFKFPMGYEYRADFRVTYKGGNVEVIDVKGMETPVFKLKMKNMAYFYPEIKVHLWKEIA